MGEKRFKLLSGGFDEKGNPLYLIKDTTDMIGDYEICNKVIEQQATIQSLKEENEQLKIRLLNCEQKKNDNGGFQVWEIPPIPKGERISFITKFGGDGV